MNPRSILLAIAAVLGALWGAERYGASQAVAADRAEARDAARVTQINHHRALEAAALRFADSVSRVQLPLRREIRQLRDSVGQLAARPLPPAPRVTAGAVDTASGLMWVTFAGDSGRYRADPRVVAALDTFARRDAMQADELQARRALDARTEILSRGQDAESGALRTGLAHADTAGTISDDRARDLKATARCRFLWFIPCPSRTEAGVAGVAVGVGLTLVLTARK